MARSLRIDIPNGLYRVTARGLERRAIIREHRDREHWLELLDRSQMGSPDGVHQMGSRLDI